jgi:hypothetical protein
VSLQSIKTNWAMITHGIVATIHEAAAGTERENLSTSSVIIRIWGTR